MSASSDQRLFFYLETAVSDIHAHDDVCNEQQNETHNYLEELSQIAQEASKNIIMGHLNINSTKTKFAMATDMLFQQLVYVMIIGFIH